MDRHRVRLTDPCDGGGHEGCQRTGGTDLVLRDEAASIGDIDIATQRIDRDVVREATGRERRRYERRERPVRIHAVLGDILGAEGTGGIGETRNRHRSGVPETERDGHQRAGRGRNARRQRGQGATRTDRIPGHAPSGLVGHVDTLPARLDRDPPRRRARRDRRRCQRHEGSVRPDPVLRDLAAVLVRHVDVPTRRIDRDRKRSTSGRDRRGRERNELPVRFDTKLRDVVAQDVRHVGVPTVRGEGDRPGTIVGDRARRHERREASVRINREL